MEHASLRLMRGLMQRGHTLQVLSLNPIGELGPLLKEANIPHEGLLYLGKGGWRTSLLLRKKLKSIQADALIMTGHHLLGMLALGDFCPGHRLLTIHFHHAGVKPAWQWRLIYRLACRRFQAVTFPSQFIRQEAETLFEPVADLAHTVNYPLDVRPMLTKEKRNGARKAIGLPLDVMVVGNAGWLIPRKRFDVFLKTAAAVLKSQPKIIFAICGDGPEGDHLAALARELGISESVRWLGWQHNMELFYSSINILLFNSDWDAMPMTPLEAMSFGVPVVCSVINGGSKEILDSDAYGFLRSHHDEQELAGLIIRLLRYPNEAIAIGLAGRARVKQLCDIGSIVEWHERVLAGGWEVFA